jgi:hypothetical protein
VTVVATGLGGTRRRASRATFDTANGSARDSEDELPAFLNSR